MSHAVLFVHGGIPFITYAHQSLRRLRFVCLPDCKRLSKKKNMFGKFCVNYVLKLIGGNTVMQRHS